MRNCRTFAELELDFPVAACALTGRNGTGKTTITQVIDVALFGPESRTLADWLSESDPQGTMSITLVFEHDGEMYRARRTYIGKGRGTSKFDLDVFGGGGHNNVILSVPGAEHVVPVEPGHVGMETSPPAESIWMPLTIESQAATTESLENLLGLTRETFRASSFISQGVMFCDLAPREQKRVLGELLNLGQWEIWLKRARAKISETKSERDRVLGVLERAEQELESKTSIENELILAQEKATDAKANLEKATAALATAREALAEEQAWVERRRNAEISLQQAERSLSELKRAIVQREDELLGLDERLAKRPELAEKAAGLADLENQREALRTKIEQWQERQRLEDEHFRLSNESGELKIQMMALNHNAEIVLAGVGSEHCDRCGQVLGQEAAERAAQSYRAEADALGLRHNRIQQAFLPDLNEKIGKLTTKEPDHLVMLDLVREIKAARSAKEQGAALEEVQARHDRAVLELEEMRAGLPDQEAFARAARSETDALGPHDPDSIGRAEFRLSMDEGAVNQARQELGVLETDIARYEERLARLDKIAAEVNDSRLRRDELHQDLDLYMQMERACGPDGVPALILENVAIPQIEAAANEILARFGSKALGLELLTQREKKDGGLADTLQIRVLTEHGARDYKTFSTGERLRINAAITLAIAQLVAARSTQTGLLVIDDLGPLDSQGMAVLVEICNELAEKIRSVFVISQSPELRDAFEQSIVLESVDGRSRIVGHDVEVAA